MSYDYIPIMAKPHLSSFKPVKGAIEKGLTEKGRGARTNVTPRYESLIRERHDDGWESLSDDFQKGTKTEVRFDTTRKIINYIKSPYVNMDRSINMYRGCEHGCIYCFARPNHAYLGYSPGLDFETKLFAKPHAAKLLAEEMAHPRYKVRTMAIGTNTDAYQPIERIYRIMHDILQVLSDFNHPVSVLTKSNLITRDLEILAPMAKKNLTRCMLSITTQDRRLARAMEPRAPTPEKRFEALKQLADNGIPTGIMLGPMIPGLNDTELESIMERAVDLGASFSAYTILRLPMEIAPLFQEWLEVFAPNRAARIMRHIREMNGGKNYDPAWSRNIQGEGSELKGTFSKLISFRYRKSQERTGIISLSRGRVPLDHSLFRVPSKISGQGDLFGP